MWYIFQVNKLLLSSEKSAPWYLASDITVECYFIRFCYNFNTLLFYNSLGCYLCYFSKCLSMHWLFQILVAGTTFFTFVKLILQLFEQNFQRIDGFINTEVCIVKSVALISIQVFSFC